MKKMRRILAAVAAVSLSGIFAASAVAQMPSGCADLDDFPERPRVDFRLQIEPILSGCTGCHGDGGAAGLDLRPGEAYGNLVGVESTTNPPQARVAPFDPADSLLLYSINCSVTGGPSFQMPGTDPGERALIRDWIAQGALARPAPRAVPVLDLLATVILALLVVLVLLRTRVRSLRSRSCQTRRR